MSKERLPFSVAYFGSLALTLYFALGVRPDFAKMCDQRLIHCSIAEINDWHADIGYRTSTFFLFCMRRSLTLSFQVAALLTYLAAYFPGGVTTLRFGGQMGAFYDKLMLSSSSDSLPVFQHFVAQGVYYHSEMTEECSRDVYGLGLYHIIGHSRPSFCDVCVDETTFTTGLSVRRQAPRQSGSSASVGHMTKDPWHSPWFTIPVSRTS